MEQLIKSVKILLENEKHDNIVYSFAYNKFREKFGGKNGVWFEGYKIINEHLLRINYGYGGGDQEMSDYFDIEI